MSKRGEFQFEIERDYPNRFIAEQYVSGGYGFHFHRNVELYFVVKGSVTVNVAGDERVLTDGQAALINGMEMHSFTVDEPAEIVYLHFGTQYLVTFYSLYERRYLPRWLTDAAYNRTLYRILRIIMQLGDVPELKRYGITMWLLSDVVERYGVREEKYESKNFDLINEVVQYIYEHYDEEITLQTLSKRFCVEAKTLSNKLYRCLGEDLRVFVNGVRAQKARQLREDPNMLGVSTKEIAKICGFKSMKTFYRTYNRAEER